MISITNAIDIIQDFADHVRDRQAARELLDVVKVLIDLADQNARLSERNAELVSQNAQLKEQVAALSGGQSQNQIAKDRIESDLPPECEQMLLFFADAGRRDITRKEALSVCGGSPGRGDYFFDQLERRAFVVQTGGRVGVGVFYGATPAGREYLFERGLLK